jgi:regulator of sigma E protease
MISLLSFTFVLGVLVFIHELGHFVVARFYGVRCLTFSLGFGPKLLQTKRGDTVYCISAIPLGGYVKMAGAGEGPDDKPEGLDDEFLSKTKWQRFQILIAGPVMNIVLAVVITTAVLYQGAQVPAYEEQPPMVGSVADDSPAAAAGIRPGDRILSVAGRDVDTWNELVYAVVPRADTQIDVVLRGDSGVRTVQVTPAARTAWNLGDLGVGPDVSPQVLDMLSTTSSAAQEAGILVGDIIEAIDGREVTQAELIETVNASPGIALTMRIRRDDVRQDIVVTPKLVGDLGLIGVALSPFEVNVVEPGPFEAFTMSLEQNYETSGLLFQTVVGLLTRDTPASQLAGPVGILQLSGQAVQVGWVVFFGFMSMLSLNLGILNLLPIPVLDGGHIFIMAMEGVSRRDFSVQMKERMQLVGLVLILTLFVTVTYNDLTRFEWIERLMIWR